ncbi:TetR/AcrR family transcriptional regulator [Thermophilibacter provencensis]|uniref:TetR/AcrR family transcriptional regulator n=1 Tax=Thermophilibacter provencensis TaxID=1852386 RepID=A0ABT7V3H7_9ACTN|nr:TetR/AcrR family transcriptional regulator [Thermophilibacter provencensis]MDM8271144.1 TetR/AcrR family transcriptional regulator [Thermophilibacter provencensis]
MATRRSARLATRKSAATREKIMAAAAELMEERGGADFQMAEVSERCGMSKGSLYYYFADRSELVRAVMEGAVDELVASVEEVVATAPSAAESIGGLLRALREAVRPGGALVLAMMHGAPAGEGTGGARVEESRLARIVEILSAQIERAKGEGLVRPEVRSGVAAAAVAGAFLVFEHVSPVVGDEVRAGEWDIARSVMDLVFSGIGTERARELLSA